MVPIATRLPRGCHVAKTLHDLRRIAHASGFYGGLLIQHHHNADGVLVASAAVVYRLVAGRRRPFRVVAKYEEFAPLAYTPAERQRRDVQPHRWLAECAEAEALALAFPAPEPASA